MGDGLKLIKDKRHRSSSSLSGVVLEGTCSERKLDIRASIPEVDEQFAIAEARCEDLREKLNMVKLLKRKRKLKKRSLTRMSDHHAPAAEAIPFISVRTQPKKKVSQQAARLRRLEFPNPTRGYLDPATVEQHQMIGHMHGYNQAYTSMQEKSLPKQTVNQKTMSKGRQRRSKADGDAASMVRGTCGQGVQINMPMQSDAAGRNDTVTPELSETDDVYSLRNEYSIPMKSTQMRQALKTSPVIGQRHFPKESALKQGTGENVEVHHPLRRTTTSPTGRRKPFNNKMQQNNAPAPQQEERPVVELFSKAGGRDIPSPEQRRSPTIDKQTKNKRVREDHQQEERVMSYLEDLPSTAMPKVIQKHPRRVKYRSRHYELPTVASQMKQAGMRYNYESPNHANIPFVVSKSTAPSHNIGVNIQQVLNGLKIQQPLSGIPLTIAHHMGLGHVPTFGSKSVTTQPSLDIREMNSIKLGQRLLRLPSYKYISFNRLLNMYREGDGMVPRFLRAISRPHYFYTSMYNLPTNREDFDGATSKVYGGRQEAKQSLAEYASIYREYEHVDKCIKDGNNGSELERRREELSKELAAREEHIRRVVQEYRPDVDHSILRATGSSAGDGYRHSTFKLNLGDPQQL